MPAGTILKSSKHCLFPEQMFLNDLDAHHAELVDSTEVDRQLGLNDSDE